MQAASCLHSPHNAATQSNEMKEYPIYLVVVESHQHALEHVHEVLRRRKILPNRWSMIHFDAHPDLACPDNDIPAYAYYQPRKRWTVAKNEDATAESIKTNEELDLYEALDLRATGIAEWIMPLALSSGLSEIHWIRSNQVESYQLPLGHFQFRAGCWDPGKNMKAERVESFLDLSEQAELKVDWDCRYYKEDGSHAPLHELQLAVPIDLYAFNDPDLLHSCTTGNPFWCLDIDLDFFACHNPFLADLEQIDSVFTKILVQTVRSSTFYAIDSGHDYFDIGQLKQYRTEVIALFQSHPEDEQALLAHDDSLNHNVSILKQYYVSSQQEDAVSNWKDLAVRFQAHSPTVQKSMLTCIRDEVLPQVDLPHLFQTDTATKQQQLEDGLATFRTFLQKQFTKRDAPFIVTIARSCADGFTPKAVVEELQTRVLQMIHTRYCGCAADSLGSCSKFAALFDYGETEGGSFFDT